MYLQHNYLLHKTDELLARSIGAKSTITAYGYKNVEEPSDLKCNSTAQHYDKIDMKWHPTRGLYFIFQMVFCAFCLRFKIRHADPSPSEPKYRKSPLSRSSPLTSFGPFPRLSQLYTRPSQLPFHPHTQHHSFSKHFHQMLNQHTTFLQNSSPVDRSAGLDFTTNIGPEAVQPNSHPNLGWIRRGVRIVCSVLK